MKRLICILQFIKDDDIDDDEIRQLLHVSSEDDGDSVWGVEKGYDGDTEASQDDWKLNGGSDPTTRREYFPSLFRLLVEMLIKCQKHQAGREILPQVLLKLLQTLKGNSAVVMVVCEEVISTGFCGILHFYRDSYFYMFIMWTSCGGSVVERQPL